VALRREDGTSPFPRSGRFLFLTGLAPPGPVARVGWLLALFKISGRKLQAGLVLLRQPRGQFLDHAGELFFLGQIGPLVGIGSFVVELVGPVLISEVAIGLWHDLLITIRSETASVSIGGKPVASFSSEGVAHPTKRVVRLVVSRQAWVDDLKVFASVVAVGK